MNWTGPKIWATITHDHELKISKNMSQIHELNWTERKWSAISFIFSHLCTTHACARTYVFEQISWIYEFYLYSFVFLIGFFDGNQLKKEEKFTKLNIVESFAPPWFSWSPRAQSAVDIFINVGMIQGAYCFVANF